MDNHQPQSTTLEQALQVLEEKQFFDASSLRLTDVMRWKDNQTLQSWSDNLLQYLVPFVKGLQAALYYADSNFQHLHKAGTYAVAVNSNLPDTIIWGDGLLGQSAKSQEFILLENLNDEHFRNASASIEIKPSALVIIPLVYNRQACGVIELSLLYTPEPQYIDFLQRISENIAANLNGLIKEKELQDSFQRIQENEDRFRRLAEVTLEGIAFTKDGRITETNTVFAEMFGYKGHEVLQETLTNFVVKLSAEIDSDIPFESIGLRKDKTTFPVEIQSRNVNYKGETLRVATFRDISERKKAEEELRQSEAQLAEAQKIVSLMDIIEKKNKNIMASINYARKIQNAILPDNKIIIEGLPQNFIFYRCKDVVSGDFYYYTNKDSQHLISAIDCTGHGVPGAFMSLIGYSQLNHIVEGRGITEPASILNNLDKAVVLSLKQHEDPTSKDGMDVALCSIDSNHKILQYAGANRPLYFIRNGELTEIKGDKFPIGGTYHKVEKKFTNHRIEIQKGDTFYIFSDGYVDQFSADNQKYMSKRFRAFLLEIVGEDMVTQQELIKQEFDNWKGATNQLDDVLVIGLRF